MLFDVRARGRRRTVQVVYVGLALLFLFGFIGYGVGAAGGGGGGIIEGLFGNGSSSTNNTNYSSQLAQARKLTVTEPHNPAAWSGLIHTALLQAGTPGYYVSNNVEGAFTPKAHGLLVEVEKAWQRYLKLVPHHPSPEVSNEVLRVYESTGGITNPRAALQAKQFAVAGQPHTAAIYSQLAVLAYQAGEKKLGERMAQKAIALAPTGERTVLENYLSKAKSTPYGESSGGNTITIPGSALQGAKIKNGKVSIPASAVTGAGTKSGTIEIPASDLPKGSTKNGTVTIPKSVIQSAEAANKKTAPGSTKK